MHNQQHNVEFDIQSSEVPQGKKISKKFNPLSITILYYHISSCVFFLQMYISMQYATIHAIAIAITIHN